MAKKLIKNKWQGPLVGLIFAVCGYMIGNFIGRAAKTPGMGPEGPLEVVWVIFLVLFAMWLAIALHELGHLAAGLAQGWSFMLFVTGFLGIIRKAEGGIKVYFNRDAKLMGGIAATIPPPNATDLLRQMAWVVAAGPLVSLLSGIVFGAIALAAYKSIQTGAPSFALLTALYLCGTCGLVSFGLFLATTLPTRAGMFFTDRARFFRLIRGGATAELEAAMLRLTAQLYSGVSATEWKQEDIEKGFADPVYAPTAYYFAYRRYLDRGEWMAAGACIPALMANAAEMPITLRREYDLEACFVAAWVDLDAEAAQKIWTDLEGPLTKARHVALWRLQAALRRAANDPEAAKAAIAEGLYSFSKLKQPTPEQMMEKRLLANMQVELETESMPG